MSLMNQLIYILDAACLVNGKNLVLMNTSYNFFKNIHLDISI